MTRYAAGTGGLFQETPPQPGGSVIFPHDATNVDIGGMFRIMVQLDARCAELTSFTTMAAPNT